MFSARSMCSCTGADSRGEALRHIGKKDVNRGGELKFVLQYRCLLHSPRQPHGRVIKLLSRLNYAGSAVPFLLLARRPESRLLESYEWTPDSVTSDQLSLEFRSVQPALKLKYWRKSIIPRKCFPSSVEELNAN